VFLADAAYRDVSGSAKLTKAELATFNARLRMAEGSLLKAGPMLDTMNVTDSLSVGYRLKTFFNHYIRNTQGNMAKVKTLVEMFREYYENFLKAEIDSRKTESGKQKYKDLLKTNLTFIDRNKQSLYFASKSILSII